MSILPIAPRHPSALKGEVRPLNMTRMGVSTEERQLLEEVSISIYTDMVNAGKSLQETLSAIYLTGLQHGKA